MYYGEIKNCDIANGEGVRVTLFVSGCTNRCKNCFQPPTAQVKIIIPAAQARATIQAAHRQTHTPARLGTRLSMKQLTTLR